MNVHHLPRSTERPFVLMYPLYVLYINMRATNRQMGARSHSESTYFDMRHKLGTYEFKCMLQTYAGCGMIVCMVVYTCVFMYCVSEITTSTNIRGRLLAGVTILLSLTVFLNMVAETMPATSDAVPLLGKVFSITYASLNLPVRTV